MCGIIGYLGKQNAAPILINGLRRLEYRGYDSAGLVVIGPNGELTRERAVGKIDVLAKKIENKNIFGSVGIAHTRWATLGGVTEANAHPHFSCGEKIVLAHNGIIENYRELKIGLLKDHKFTSETDSEVLAHLIEHFYRDNLRLAVEKALALVVGTYGIAVVSANEPQKIVCARRGSPLVLGVADDGFLIASDASPLLPYTKRVVYLDDGEILEITPEKFQIFNLRDEQIQKNAEQIEWTEAQAQMHGFPHFMLKEIFDQPQVFQDALAGRLLPQDGTAHLGGLNLSEDDLRQIERIVIVACGTAFYASLVGKYAIEHCTGLPVSVEIASEFRYRDPVILSHTLVLAVSQSGETADTLAAMREAKNKGAIVMGIVNVVGSTIAREAGRGVYIHAGPELAVASTKAFTNQAAILVLLGLQLGRQRRISLVKGQQIIEEIKQIPVKMKNILTQSENIKNIAEKYHGYEHMFFLGRGINYPLALEGALKLKEISYIHAEGYPAGEMKHGPIALIDEKCPVFGIMTKDSLYDKTRSNIEEIRARKGRVILLATNGDEEARRLAEDVIFVPLTMEMLEPFLNVLPLQLFAYHMAVLRGKDVDRPRNLAKSVTVE
jgi:glucosamine--fructose-6-phosphate aminotransferase (isomerizing)